MAFILRIVALVLISHSAWAEEALIVDPQKLLPESAAKQISETLQRHREITRDELFVRLSGSPGDPQLKTAKAMADYWFSKVRPGIPNRQNGALLWINTEKKEAYLRVGYGWDSSIQEKTANQIVKKHLIPRMGTPKFAASLAVVVQEVFVEIESPLALSGELSQSLGPLLQQIGPEETETASRAIPWGWLVLALGMSVFGVASYQFIAKELVCDAEGWKPSALRLVYADFDLRSLAKKEGKLVPPEERGGGVWGDF